VEFIIPSKLTVGKTGVQPQIRYRSPRFFGALGRNVIDVG
jgi:hypothetical protein